MRFEGGRGTDPKVLVQTSQSRVFMVAGEAVAFSLRAVDAQGAAQPLVVTGAQARGVTFGSSRPAAQVTLPFADDGAGADPVAGDSHFAAVLAPAQTGLALFNGTIRTEVRYSVNGRAGVVVFDVIYSPDVPAVWAGQAREAVEDGSLVYVLKADVRQAGRYLVTGRVDDAAGKPFALATFNDVLRAGPNEIRLAVFGKLLHDKAAAMPLALRDVEGYLLKEDTDPDRALMPRLEGRVVAGKPHALNRFSDAEWQGEERTRHLAEFGKDAALARKALAEFDPSLPPPVSRCAR
ncbi:MAG: choice-of-anchor X domain-containing protein, partial [Telluria sp.]